MKMPLLSTLLSTFDAVAAIVKGGHWLVPLILCSVALMWANVTFAIRWNASVAVVEELTASGRLSKLSESDLAEQIQLAQRTKLVKGVLGALVGFPIQFFLAALFVRFMLWLSGLSMDWTSVLSAIAVALMPLALFYLIQGAATLGQIEISEKQLVTLVPSHVLAWGWKASGVTARILSAVDFFRLWGVFWLGRAFACDGRLKAPKSFLFAGMLYVMYVAFFDVGWAGFSGGAR